MKESPSPDQLDADLWLIGAGPMAVDYARVLLALNRSFAVIGRGEESARSFERALGIKVFRGGLRFALSCHAPPKQAIVAVGVAYLAGSAIDLIKAGTRHILLEKPAGVNLTEVAQVELEAATLGAKVLLGYNRRFYASVLQAREYIDDDGGLQSVQFEFTEWSHLIAPQALESRVKTHWLIANSSHVIDLAFHLGGRPVDWGSWHLGSIDWHPSAARFAGSGLTDQRVLFSYLSDWQAPGRWGVELLTAKHRFVLRPMEQLQKIRLGQLSPEPVDLRDTLDHEFKPGLYRQTESFLSGDHARLCSINEQVENIRLYSRMAGYS